MIKGLILTITKIKNWTCSEVIIIKDQNHTKTIREGIKLQSSLKRYLGVIIWNFGHVFILFYFK